LTRAEKDRGNTRVYSEEEGSLSNLIEGKSALRFLKRFSLKRTGLAQTNKGIPRDRGESPPV